MQSFADALFDALVARFSLDRSDDARVAFVAAVVASDALCARAFRLDPAGDTPYLEAGRTATVALLAPYWSAP